MMPLNVNPACTKELVTLPNNLPLAPSNTFVYSFVFTS